MSPGRRSSQGGAGWEKPLIPGPTLLQEETCLVPPVASAGQLWMTLQHIHQISEFCPGSGATWGWGACLHTPASARGKQEPSSPDTRAL